MGSLLDKNSSQVRKRIETHEFTDEQGEEYEANEFGGFGDYFRRKKIKLQNLDADLRTASSGLPQIFNGVVAHVSGYTQPPLHVLHRELVRHGACFLQYLDSKTMATHIIASSLTPKKAIEFARYRIVKPAWVTDSIKEGKLLPWTNYRVITEGPRQNTLKLEGGKVLSQSNSPARVGYKDQTQHSFYNGQFKTSPQPTTSPGTLSTPTPQTKRQTPLSLEFSAPSPVTPINPPTKPPDLPMTDAEDPDVPDGSPPPPSPIRVPPDAEEQRIMDKTGFSEHNKPDAEALKNMTSEEYNAWLLEDPRIRKSSSANPNFLQQFYSESRLHHLSTWKAELKSKMQRLASEKGPVMKPVKRAPGARRYIMHVDFDSFFCAVSLKKNPQYDDKPTVVAHGAGTGSEIASCNYVARKFGVKNGMWMKRALEMCPDLKVLPYDFPAYEEASRHFYEAILEIGGVVQSVSIDEALVDATDIILNKAGSRGKGVDEGSIWREQEEVNKVATELRVKIKERTGCAVSVGIGANILLAKVALRKAKPDGQHQVLPEEVLDLLGELEVRSLPGVAYSIGGKLEELGIKFVKDIRETTKERLTTVLGPKTGERLWDYARGIDKTEVGDQPPRKSVSAEVSWGIRFINQAEAEEFVMNLCKELERRMLNEQVKGKHLTLKVMRRALDAPFDTVKHLGHGKCDTFNKSTVFGVATNDAGAVGREAVSLLRSFRFSPGDLRGLGAQMTKLEPIKSSSTVDGSQKRLQFSVRSAPSPIPKRAPDPIEDVPSPVRQATDTPGRRAERDPIDEDPTTPRKPKGPSHPALARARYYESDPKATTPLNVSGTQFVLPPNPDPAVVAELPMDIRSRLMGQGSRSHTPRQETPTTRSRQGTPTFNGPLPSQIDPEVFNALPDDMKAEVLASYGRRESPVGASPQPARSPHADKVAPALRKATTPTKRGGRSMWSKARERHRDAEAGLHQTNFLGARPGEQSNTNNNGNESEPEELDPAILAELPEDVRREVLEDQRRQRLARKSGLNVSGPSGNSRRPASGDHPPREAGGQTRLVFPAPPVKMAFGTAGLSSTEEIREMLNTWHARTRWSGPHGGDVDMFGKYLARVVAEERDMEKAASLVRWLEVLVDGGGTEVAKGRPYWERALGKIKDAVQEGARKRGLRGLNI